MCCLSTTMTRNQDVFASVAVQGVGYKYNDDFIMPLTLQRSQIKLPVPIHLAGSPGRAHVREHGRDGASVLGSSQMKSNDASRQEPDYLTPDYSSSIRSCFMPIAEISHFLLLNKSNSVIVLQFGGGTDVIDMLSRPLGVPVGPRCHPPIATTARFRPTPQQEDKEIKRRRKMQNSSAERLLHHDGHLKKPPRIYVAAVVRAMTQKTWLHSNKQKEGEGQRRDGTARLCGENLGKGK
ncbi:hypothetical protein J3F83DRAFT_164502 [Trichoderma novae-zelandiae]